MTAVMVDTPDPGHFWAWQRTATIAPPSHCRRLSVNKLNHSLLVTLVSFGAALLVGIGADPAQADVMNPFQMAASTPPPPSIGQSLLERVRGLQGTWDAQTSLGVITDTFQPFAYDSAVLGEELLN